MTEPQRTLVLLRHAKSARPEGVQDRERPLNDRGRRDAPEAGRWLRQHVPHVEFVLCSPARRAEETWELAGSRMPAAPSVRRAERLYEAGAQDLLAAVHELPVVPLTAVLIGHDPTISEFVGLLTGQPVSLKTSGIAVVTSAQPWSAAGDGWGRLTETATPRG
ncbi:histidine phosphatase family protein [Salinifilum aidingensis]